MTIQQLKYAMTIAEYGSISKAAQALFVSQPHLSKSIQTLEAEVQYPIFARKASGVTPTSQGRLFLNKARAILDQYQGILSLSTLDTVHSFHVSGTNLYMVLSAFRATCQEFEGDLIDFRLINQGRGRTVEDVYSGKAEIGTLVVSEVLLDPILFTCQNKNIAYRTVARMPMAITLREGHPLIRDMESSIAAGEALPTEKLRVYPFVDYSEYETARVLEGKYPACVNREKIIVVNEMLARHQILSQTDAYSMGCVLAEETLAAYHLLSFPIPGFFYHLVYIFRKDNELSEECQVFIQHLERETKLYYPAMFAPENSQ